MKQAIFVRALAWSLLFSLTAFSQQTNTGSKQKTSAPAKPTPTPSKEAEPELTPQQLRALSLVREAAQEAGKLDDKRSGATIQAKAADLLWPHDQVAAKELFAKAFDTGLAHYRDTNDDNRRQTSKNTFATRPDVLLDVIHLVNTHDRELARGYTDKYIEEKKRQREAKGAQSSDSYANRMLGDNQAAAAGLWRVADALLETDVKLSAEVAARAAMLTVTPEGAGYLQKLFLRDRKLSDQLFVQALNRLRVDPAPLPSQLLMLTAYPFALGWVKMLDGRSSSSNGVGVPPNFTPDLALIRQFLTVAYGVLTRIADPGTAQLPDAAGRYVAAMYALKLLELKVAEFQPALLENWRVMIAQMTTLVAERDRQFLESNVRNDTASPRERSSVSDQQDQIKSTLERAERATDISQRDMFYAQAAMYANNANEPERGLDIAGKIMDLTLRRAVKSWIARVAAERAVSDKRWDDAHRYALEIEAAELRAYVFLQLADGLRKSGDHARAASQLEEAYHQAEAAENSPGKVKAMLGIANAYATSDFVRGYEVAEAAAKTINQLPRDKPGLDPDDTGWFSVVTYGQGSTSSSGSVEGFDLGRTLANLAKRDLERGLALLRDLDHPALRYTATMTVAESLLKTAAK